MNNPLNILAQVPADIEAENAIIGACLINKEAIQLICDILNPDDFYDKKNQESYAAMLSLEDKASTIDMITVNNVLKKKKYDFLSHLTDCVNTSLGLSGLKQYAKIVKEKRVLRELLATSNELIDNVKSGDGDADDMLDMVEQRILSISKKNGKKSYYSVGELSGGAVERFNMLASGKIEAGILTGFKALDEIIFGIHRSDVVIIGARTSVGKSSLAMSLANNVASQGHAVAFFSLEMSKEQLTDRLYSMRTGIGLTELTTGNFRTEELKNEAIAKVAKEAEIMDDLLIEIDDTSNQTVFEIKRKCRRIKAEKKNLSLVVIDYLQLLRSKKDYGSTYEQVSDISRSLKALAKELDVTVVALSQLSRNIEQRDDPTPKLSDLRDSGAIEADADIVIVITASSTKYSENYEHDYKHKDLHVLKHRNGPIGLAKIEFDRQTVSFK
jgi:replicative DNA helicase